MAVFANDLTTTNRQPIPINPLYQPSRISGEVIHHFWRVDRQGVIVDYINICLHAWRD